MEHGTRIAEGRTAEIFAWGERKVLKLFRAGWAVEAADHEAAIAQALAAAGVPCPAYHGRVEVEGRPAIMYERIAGPSLEDMVRSKPWHLGRVARLLAETQARVQACVVPGLPPLRQVLERKIRGATPLPAAMQAAALRALERLPDGSALCHGDFHLGNVLLSARGPVVIDWENASCGHPLADVARTMLLLRMGSIYPKSGLQRALLRGAIARLLAVYLRRYRRLVPCPPEELAAWQLPVAAARLSEGIKEEEPHVLALVARLAANHEQ